jgi:transposase
MIGNKDRSKQTLFIVGDIDQFIPEDHILKRVDRCLDLSWLQQAVKSCYCLDNGRPSIAPEAAVRLMLAGFFQGIVHDRKLMREAQVNLAIRWFAGYGLDESLPDHSSLSRIRERWGAERFREIFRKTVQACIDAGLVSGETVHLDSTLNRADVSWASIVAKHADDVIRENTEDSVGDPATDVSPQRRGRPRTRDKRPKKVSLTDPDATMATSSGNYQLEPTYKQHTAVDDKSGILLDVAVTTGEVNEGTKLIETVERVEHITGKQITHVTADTGYAHSANYQALEQRGADAIIPPQRESNFRKGNLSIRRFKYDGLHQRLVCPGGNVLTRSSRAKNGWFYKSKISDCRCCPLYHCCVPSSAKVRSILIVDGYEALLRARRRRQRGWNEQTRRLYNRHRTLVEGIHGEAKTQHGLRRAVRRGLDNVAIQVYLTAAVINLKRIAAAMYGQRFYGYFCILVRFVVAFSTVMSVASKRNLPMIRYAII